jgi:hypothetical protein
VGGVEVEDEPGGTRPHDPENFFHLAGKEVDPPVGQAGRKEGDDFPILPLRVAEREFHRVALDPPGVIKLLIQPIERFL